MYITLNRESKILTLFVVTSTNTLNKIN